VRPQPSNAVQAGRIAMPKTPESRGADTIGKGTPTPMPPSASWTKSLKSGSVNVILDGPDMAFDRTAQNKPRSNTPSGVPHKQPTVKTDGAALVAKTVVQEEHRPKGQFRIEDGNHAKTIR
jgi:hypothetical protein